MLAQNTQELRELISVALANNFDHNNKDQQKSYSNINININLENKNTRSDSQDLDNNNNPVSYEFTENPEIANSSIRNLLNKIGIIDLLNRKLDLLV